MKFLLLLAVPILVVSQTNDRLKYEIVKQWNGQDIDHLDNPVRVELFPVNNDLGVQISGPVYGSPKVSEEYQVLPRQCPARSCKHLWNQEVAEVYFANDANQYLKVQLSPYGFYKVALYEDYKEKVLYGLPLEVTRNKDCFNGDCPDGFSYTLVVPRDYFPRQVSKFNAHAKHGPTGVEDPSKKEFVYESLYPVDPEVVTKPDFHNLQAFQPIDLASIGFDLNKEDTQTWREATCITRDVHLTFNITQRSQCEPVPEGYHAQVDLVKNTERRVVTVRVRVNDVAGVVPNVPEKFRHVGQCTDLDSTSESFWVSFSNKYNESIRVGVNPYGVYRVQLFQGLEEVPYNNYSLKAVQCQREEGSPAWECYLEIPQCVLPPKASFYQFVHAHVGLTGNDGVQPTEFIGTACPGVSNYSPFVGGEVDWLGCLIDDDVLVNRYSKVWIQGLKKAHEEQSEVEEETEGNENEENNEDGDDDQE